MKIISIITLTIAGMSMLACFPENGQTSNKPDKPDVSSNSSLNQDGNKPHDGNSHTRIYHSPNVYPIIVGGSGNAMPSSSTSTSNLRSKGPSSSARLSTPSAKMSSSTSSSSSSSSSRSSYSSSGSSGSSYSSSGSSFRPSRSSYSYSSGRRR